MIEIFTRSPPYGNENPVTAAALVSSGKLVPTLPSFVHPTVATLINSCFAYEPNVRPDFKTVANLAESVESVISLS